MQDSIEDYIKIATNTKQEQIDNEKRKEILLTAQRKKACEDYSLKIVEFLIDGQLKPVTFLTCLKHINQDLYQDIVEERSLSKLCGYPLCGKSIPEMPKKQYYISIKANKVYDITDRKNYCCNFCYKASLHIKSQIETSPLWLRKPDDIPNFSLLPNTENGLPGQLISHGIAKEEIEPTFTSITSFANLSMQEVEKLEVDTKEKEKEKRILKQKQHKTKLSQIKECNTIYEEDEGVDDDDGDYDENVVQMVQNGFEKDFEDMLTFSSKEKESSTLFHKVNDNEEESRGILKKALRIEQKTDINAEIRSYKNKINNALKTNNQKELIKSVRKVELNNKDLDEKLNAAIEKCKAKSKKEKTIIYTDILPINQKVQTKTHNFQTDISVVKHRSQEGVKRKPPVFKDIILEQIKTNEDDWRVVKTNIKEWFTLESYIFLHGYDKIKDYLGETILSKYFDSLKVNELETQQKLKYMEICKRLKLREMAEAKFDKTIDLKPLPNYQKLKEDNKELNLKVHSFYEGSLYVKENKQISSESKNDETQDDSTEIVLPLPDASSKHALRRKVLTNSIQKTLNLHIRELRINKLEILEKVQILVKTFKLDANNVVFKPIYFEIISIVFINLLAVQNKELMLQLQEDNNKLFTESIVNKYPDGLSFFKEIISFINDIDSFVKYYVCRIK